MTDHPHVVTVTVRFTVYTESDSHLQSEPAIRAELASWLESLRATVHTVVVHGSRAAARCQRCGALEADHMDYGRHELVCPTTKFQSFKGERS
jgi:hypothetical protein